MNLLQKFYYKFRINVIWNIFLSTLDRLHWEKFKIMSVSDTVDYILENQCSLARFGDGELQIAAYGCGLKFQRPDAELQHKLLQVMNSSNPSLLLCLPNRINAISSKERKLLSSYWIKSLRQHLHAWTKNLDKAQYYGDTNLSRLTEGEDEDAKIQLVEHIKLIWNSRNVLLVEGEKTRFGVGNSLLEHALTVRRILGPAESAFDYYQELLKCCYTEATKMKNPIVILALGPTATVLASDLADLGIQAIDLGHLDISYERLTTGITGAIPEKYTNEAQGGNVVADCRDSNYWKQIIACVGI